MAEVAAPSREPSAAGPVVTGTSGQREPSLRSTIACFFGFYGLVLLPALCTLGPLYMLWKGTLLTKTIAVILIVTYYRYVFDGAEHKLGWDVPWFYNHPFWEVFGEYFPVHVVKSNPASPPLPPQKAHIFAVHPHGVIGFGRMMLTSRRDKFFNPQCGGGRICVLAASICFYIPGLREFYMALSTVDAGRRTAEHVLKNGHNLMLYPGGEAEQLSQQYDQPVAYIKSRKGFVSLAIEFNTPIVPAYIFGESRIYHIINFLLPLRQWLSQTFRMAIPLCNGKYGLVPYPVPMTCVVGDPIVPSDVLGDEFAAAQAAAQATDKKGKHSQSPVLTQAMDKVHAVYIEQLKAIFDRHKAEFGDANKELHVL